MLETCPKKFLIRKKVNKSKQKSSLYLPTSWKTFMFVVSVQMRQMARLAFLFISTKIRVIIEKHCLHILTAIIAAAALLNPA